MTASPADRLPPQNLEAELGALGSILLDNDLLPEVTPKLRGDEFYRGAHRDVYRAILRLDAAGQPVDTLTVAEELVRTGAYDLTGALELVTACVQSVPHAANGAYYAAIVAQKSVTRGVIEACNETLAEAYGNQHTSQALADNLCRRAAAVAEAGTADAVTGPAGPLGAFLDRMDRRQAGPTGLTSGFRQLDDMTDGWQGGMLYVVAGRPGMGKSVLALNAADHAAAAGATVLYFSLEMRSQELCERLLCARTGVWSTKLRDPASLTQYQMRLLGEAHAALKATPLLFDDTPLYNMTQVAGITRKYQRSAGVRLVVIDYLQLLDMDEPGERESREQKVARASRRLKVMARSLDIPVVILSQLNRESERREDRKPRMADLRESGAIEQDADAIIMVHRPEYYDPLDQPGVVQLIVNKNRNGATGVAEATADLAAFRFLDGPPVPQAARPDPAAADGRAAAAGDF